MNDDGKDDVVTYRLEGSATAWGYSDDEDLGLRWMRKAPLQSKNLKAVAFADFDGDGDLDGVTKTSLKIPMMISQSSSTTRTMVQVV